MKIKKEQLNEYVGQEIAVTDWLTIDQNMINQFAELTLDRQFIHIDPVRAKNTPFGGTIAHGLLTLSLVAYFVEKSEFNVEGFLVRVNYGFDKVRFLSPVPSGSRLRSRIKLLSAEEKRPGQLMLHIEVTGEVEGSSRPAMVAEYLELRLAE
ncbi:MAG: MaoC family dehydratase [Pseudomonadales bacterium]|nr:MaoC family dehydratase [Pseudomonadales bacterium]